MILAFTGAGISKASGIPTFTDQGDLRLKLSRSYAIQHKEEYNSIIENMQSVCEKAEPNDAHRALAEYNIPVITMNIDRLHQRAGSLDVLPIHGDLPDIVLYEDPAPLYSQAIDWVFKLRPGDIFIIVGVSFYTNISTQLKIIALSRGATVELINKNAETELRKFLETNKDSIETFETFINREEE